MKEKVHLVNLKSIFRNVFEIHIFIFTYIKKMRLRSISEGFKEKSLHHEIIKYQYRKKKKS